jgi:RES domain-containing protein
LRDATELSSIFSVRATVWRICKRQLLRNAFTGEGAATNGGRWNSPGTPTVYTAESQSLAALEILTHTADPNNLIDLNYVAIPVELDEQMIIEAAKLPRDWRSYPAPHSTMKFGDLWIRAKLSLALRVPSAIIPSECNYLLNPAHPDFLKLSIGKPLSFEFDSRLAFSPGKQSQKI